MLSEKRINVILGTSFSSLNINDIHWRTQDSTQTSILFYRIGDDDQARSLFTQRMKKAVFGLLIVNRNIPDLPVNHVVSSEEHWPDVQKALLDELFPMPPMKFMALTGTNGKTTTTDLVLQIGSLMGKNGLSIGTLGVRENHRTILDFGLTSPSYIDLRKFLHSYGQNKDFCVLEASSHALTQSRLHGLVFDGAGFTSFSQDHLDYHHTMDEYFEAKCLIFKQLGPRARLFVPVDQTELYTKLKSKSDKVAKAREVTGKLPLFFSTSFNKNNLDVAVSIVESVFQIKVPSNLESLSSPDGRFHISPYRSNFIVVDFAHTPDALDNICKGIRSTFPGHKLKVLFGCGGDRDRSKRPLMGAVVEKWADEIYVTSDNPRSEDPAQIIEDIMRGIKLKKSYQIVDRKEAVNQAFAQMSENEVLLLAGKGHEDYILIKGIKYPYSDIKEVEEFLLKE